MFDLIKFNPRIWFLLGFISCFLMLSVGAYFQFVEEMEPCPLCISQRIAILATGIIFLIGAIHNPQKGGVKAYAILGALTALIGGGISIRHVWIQNLPPDEIPECGPGLGYVFDNFPLIDTITLMFSGTGDCADILWTFLGISIPGWTLVAFLGLAALSLLQIWNTPKAS
ncbi:MAG: disulfide bond formation protein B [Methylococcales bacterium]|nr:disulfide bond formation protein B [Methylococcales bacterium]